MVRTRTRIGIALPMCACAEICYGSLVPASFAACAACLSLRAAFRVCHDLLSVFGFGFSFLCDSRLFGVVVVAMIPL
jgi:hypothetical protein